MRRGHGRRQKHGSGGGGRRDVIEGSCECPRCGYKMSHQAAVPCSHIPCPRCGTPMGESN